VASSPESLYTPAVLAHARAPSRRGQVAGATHAGDGRNRPCGDTVQLTLAVADGRVAAIRFEAEGCALCLAATSALCDAVEGLPLADARAAAAALLHALEGAAAPSDAAPPAGDLALFTPVAAFPARRGCVTLAASILAGLIRSA
jgi:nitrogen fixation NifU-like protein